MPDSDVDKQNNLMILERVICNEFSPGAAAKILREIEVDKEPVGELIRYWLTVEHKAR